MIQVVNVQPHATMADLMTVIAESEELNSIKLRRPEKKLLNSINTDRAEGGVRFFVPDEKKPAKPKARIQRGSEKIFILVGVVC